MMGKNEGISDHTNAEISCEIATMIGYAIRSREESTRTDDNPQTGPPSIASRSSKDGILTSGASSNVKIVMNRAAKCVVIKHFINSKVYICGTAMIYKTNSNV